MHTKRVGKVACLQGKSQMPHLEIRMKTMFPTLYADVLLRAMPACLGGLVTDTLDNFYVNLIDQFFPLPTPQPSILPKIWLAIQMG